MELSLYLTSKESSVPEHGLKHSIRLQRRINGYSLLQHPEIHGRIIFQYSLQMDSIEIRQSLILFMQYFRDMQSFQRLNGMKGQMYLTSIEDRFLLT